jgi:YaiO family outer membrane protein
MFKKKVIAKNLLLVFLFFGLVFVFCINAFAEDEAEKKNRIEADLSYEYLTPHSDYGWWKGLSLGFYRKPQDDLTYFIQTGFFDRKEGSAFLGAVGAYKDWTDYFYTYSSVSSGSNSDYLPRIRFDNDFNFKLGPEKNLVWLAGFTFMRYFSEHRDMILSTGLKLYYPSDWIWEYRIFRNDSDPGHVISYSHLFSIGYGREKWQWTNLDISYGKQAYLATNVESPERINQDAFRVALKNKLWLGKDYGVMEELSYFKLQDGYKKYGLSVGFFKEF